MPVPSVIPRRPSIFILFCWLGLVVQSAGRTGPELLAQSVKSPNNGSRCQHAAWPLDDIAAPGGVAQSRPCSGKGMRKVPAHIDRQRLLQVRAPGRRCSSFRQRIVESPAAMREFKAAKSARQGTCEKARGLLKRKVRRKLFALRQPHKQEQR